VPCVAFYLAVKKNVLRGSTWWPTLGIHELANLDSGYTEPPEPTINEDFVILTHAP
jgi:hypothetical protein